MPRPPYEPASWHSLSRLTFWLSICNTGLPLPRGSKIKGHLSIRHECLTGSVLTCPASVVTFSRDIVICRSIMRHFFVLVNAVLAWSGAEIIHRPNMAGRQGPSERCTPLGLSFPPLSRRPLHEATDGYAAPKAPPGITCHKFLWFQKWFLETQRFKNHHWNLRIIKILWNHPPFSGHFATFSGFARKFYIVLQPWLTHGQPVHNGARQCQ